MQLSFFSSSLVFCQANMHVMPKTYDRTQGKDMLQPYATRTDYVGCNISTLDTHTHKKKEKGMDMKTCIFFVNLNHIH